MTGSLRVPREFGDGYLRVGDAERDKALDALGKHYAAGRLSAEELEERITATLQARTRSDLSALFRDLPSTGAAWQPAPRGRPDYWRVASRVLTAAAVAALIFGVVVVLLFVVLVTTMMAFGGLMWLVLLWWLLTSGLRCGHRSYRCRSHRRQAYWPSRGYTTWV
jgi:hypothetical protein